MRLHYSSLLLTYVFYKIAIKHYSSFLSNFGHVVKDSIMHMEDKEVYCLSVKR